jgi:hypothetical protein
MKTGYGIAPLTPTPGAEITGLDISHLDQANF